MLTTGASPGRIPNGGWKNGDLAIREWFLDVGHRLDFEMLHVIEWDLVLFGPIREIYRHIGGQEVGLTGLTDLSAVERRWDWTSDPDLKPEWDELRRIAQETYGYQGPHHACLGP